MKAYLAAEGFERELAAELAGKIASEHGRLILTEENEPATAAAWAQNVWLDPREVAFASIGEAARKLRELGPLWSLHSTKLHRRASLIQEKLKSPGAGREIEFLSPLPKAPMGAWTLLSENRLLASPRCSSPFADGEARFKENKTEPPSRAYLKLWELFTVHGVRPRKGEHCIDLGASPGGWTWVLASLGCKVTAVDRSPLADEVARLPGVTFVKGNAFTAEPKDFAGVDWMFSDVICYPEQIEELIGKWRASGLCRNFVCTVKFKGATDHEVAKRLAAIPGTRLQHLFHNKHELTWWLTA